MSETKLSSMTPDERALACHRCRFADEESNVGMLTLAIRQAESEAASAAFLRGFEAGGRRARSGSSAIWMPRTIWRSASAPSHRPTRVRRPSPALRRRRKSNEARSADPIA